MDVAQSNTSAAELCLQNPIITRKILKCFSKKIMKNLKFRLINKSFDSEMLYRIRVTHRSIHMEVPGAQAFRLLGKKGEPEEIGIVLVNGVETTGISGYLRFLRKIANVKVENLVMTNFWATVSCEIWRESLHKEIHELLGKQTVKTFTGMSDLCDGYCNDCYSLASTSSEYGPLQVGIGRSLLKKKKRFHFQKLIIDERHLHSTASNQFLKGSLKTWKRYMRYSVNPRISCDQLCFKISEFPYKSKKRLRSKPFPLEVIGVMCDVWKPDSIVIEYDVWPQNVSIWDTWSGGRSFFPVLLDGLYEIDVNEDYDVEKLRKFSSVTVDMRNTEKMYREVIDGSINEDESYSNLIANVKGLFPTDKIIIIGERYSRRKNPINLNQKTFQNILKSVWKNTGHMEVTIRHDVVIFKNPNNTFDIPESIDILDHRLKCVLLPEKLFSRKNFIGRKFQITDELCEKTLNLELFVFKKQLNLLVKRRKGTNEDPLGQKFLHHFYDSNNKLLFTN